ncbi:MAG TPA: glycosyltransferase [Candidatus Syntrophosphaera sp.]|nr:glycosyltransferase [Candidatus Syntrophosphaera sp.]
MKVLFVCRGHGKARPRISPITKAQARSLERAGLSVDIFPLRGNWIKAYLGSVLQLRSYIKKTKPDIVHGHYSLCGFTATLASPKPVIVSLMGSDVKQSGLLRLITKFFANHIWKVTIVKSQDIKLSLGLDSVFVLPNGVDLDMFKPMPRENCRRELGWPESNKIILFAADPKRNEKNFSLAKASCEKLDSHFVVLKVVHGVKQETMPVIINASDLLLLTSVWEGSPNVVKEAMACNIPVVSTNVGDVDALFGDTQGYFIAKPETDDVRRKVDACLAYPQKVNGRDRLISLNLDASVIAAKLIDLYEKV